ncbi:MAG: hypothetical protein J3R72DRAFT_529744, partial [Linnemannia gamsii]
VDRQPTQATQATQPPFTFKTNTHTTNHVSLQVQQEQDRLCCHHPCSDPSSLGRCPTPFCSTYQDDPRAGTRGGYAQDCPSSYFQHELQPSVDNAIHPKLFQKDRSSSTLIPTIHFGIFLHQYKIHPASSSSNIK